MNRLLQIIKVAVLGVVISLTLTNCSMSSQTYRIKDGKIVYKVPKREPGQTNTIELRAPKLDVVRIGFIGIGKRGSWAVKRFTNMPGIEIKALCDYLPENVEKNQKVLEKANFPRPVGYSGEEGWKELCERDDIDLIYITTDWKNHANIGVYAMEQGKHVAIEVPAAMTMDEIWALVNTSEKTRKHCIQLENCVYDFFELTTLNMAQQGLFGEILHVEGAYIHDLTPFWDRYWNNWRLDYNAKHRGDVYPTHGIGPVCQVLNIHRGDKMNYLVAMDTKSVMGKERYKKKTGEDIDFKNGDHTLTLIRTEKGKTIHIQHNVMTPRPYSRMYQLTGTEGFANKYPTSGYAIGPTDALEGVVKNHESLNAHGFVSADVRKLLMEKYKHQIHQEIGELAKKVGGHGGMDFIMDYRIIYCLQNGLPLDMDVYDLAEWCSLVELTGVSMDHGSMPVEIPDFTRGHWNDLKGLKFHFVEKD